MTKDYLTNQEFAVKDLLLRAMNLAQVCGAQYAGARMVDTTTERINVKNGVATDLSVGESQGFTKNESKI